MKQHSAYVNCFKCIYCDKTKTKCTSVDENGKHICLIKHHNVGIRRNKICNLIMGILVRDGELRAIDIVVELKRLDIKISAYKVAGLFIDSKTLHDATIRYKKFKDQPYFYKLRE